MSTSSRRLFLAAISGAAVGTTIINRATAARDAVVDPLSERASTHSKVQTESVTRVGRRGAPPHYDSPNLDKYLQRMPVLSGVLTEATASGQLPLAHLSVLLVHHFSAEILGTIAALRKLGCRDVTVVFVGYNPDLEGAYRPDLDSIPADELRCYILEAAKGATEAAEPNYFVPLTFVRQPKRETTEPLKRLNDTLAAKGLDFFSAMRALVVEVSLAQLARAHLAGRKVLIVEDGGYTAPILNDAALARLEVSQLRSRFFAPANASTDAALPSNLSTVMAECVIGSVEHTRNGYDLNMQTYATQGRRLAVPAFTIALSYMKTQMESETVAATIINAVESVLYSQGVSLRRRKAFVFGSRGNIGRRLMTRLRSDVDFPDDSLIGCDLKVGHEETKTPMPSWQFHPSQSSAGGSSEIATYEELDTDRAGRLDLIIGVTGGPMPGHPVLRVQDVLDWLLKGQATTLYLASGSTKTNEFPEILTWMNSLLHQATELNESVPIVLAGHRSHIQKQDVLDTLSRRSYGSRYVFTIEQHDGSARERHILLLQNLLPVNFLFYGVPTEIIDQVLAQLISASLLFVRTVGSLPEPRVYGVDYDPEASTGVYGARAPASGQRIPLPGPIEA
jgi:hypothetical protein